MRKYILSIILIGTGLIVLTLNYFDQKSIEYSESAFAGHARKFDDVFGEFSTEVKDNVFRIKEHFNDSLTIKDTVSTRNYFMDQLNGFPSLMSIALFQDTYKLVARKENSSRIYAIDSTSGLDVVRWRRFENGQQVSSWYESFEAPVSSTVWYQELLMKNDQLKWYLRKNFKAFNDDKDDFIYVGYSYLINDKKSVIILEFSRKNLLEDFKLSKGNLKPKLSFMNVDGKELHIESSSLTQVDSTSLNPEEKDSLQILIASHFSKFKDVSQGNFNFSHDNEVYWNSFKRFSEDSGLQYYLFTISNSDLQSNTNGFLKGFLSYLALGLILAGLILLFIRKRYFYRANRMEIPSVSEILEDDENRYLEFKSSLRWDYRQEKVNPELEKIIMKTIAAFGNTDGGILLIGVDDDKNIIGLENDFQTLKKTDADYYEVHLRNIMHKLMGVKYVSKFIRTQFEVFEDQKIVCKIKVISADEPLYLKYTNKNGQVEEKFYVRSGNSSHEIKSIAEINDYINKKFK